MARTRSAEYASLQYLSVYFDQVLSLSNILLSLLRVPSVRDKKLLFFYEVVQYINNISTLYNKHRYTGILLWNLNKYFKIKEKNIQHKYTYKCFADSTKHNGWLAFNQKILVYINVEIQSSIHIWMSTLLPKSKIKYIHSCSW